MTGDTFCTQKIKLLLLISLSLNLFVHSQIKRGKDMFDGDYISALNILNEGNYETGLKMLETSANNGNSSAQYMLGILFLTRSGNVTKDLEKGMGWLKQSSENGHETALFNLGYYYNEGIHVDKNIQKAISYYEKGAKLGSMECAFNLGILYYNADAGNETEHKAATAFKMAYGNFASVFTLNAAQRICKAKGDLAYKLKDYFLANKCYLEAFKNERKTYPEAWVADTDAYALNMITVP